MRAVEWEGLRLYYPAPHKYEPGRINRELWLLKLIKREFVPLWIGFHVWFL